MALDRAMVIGYLGQDPETRFLPSGQPVVGFSVATDESFIDKEGHKQERVEWHNIVAFARLGEICAEYLKKGRQVFIEGRLRTREYEAKNGEASVSAPILLPLACNSSRRRQRRRQKLRALLRNLHITATTLRSDDTPF